VHAGMELKSAQPNESAHTTESEKEAPSEVSHARNCQWQPRGAQIVLAQSDSAGTTPSSSWDASCPSSEESCSEWQRQLQGVPAASSANLDYDQIPRDDDGFPTSIGSIGHATGDCVPCDFVFKPLGCRNGMFCSFCHLKNHTSSRQRNRERPCKGKRQRHQKFMDRMKTMAQDNPHNFNIEDVELPPSIEASEALKAKVAAKVQMYKTQVLGATNADTTCGGSSASASAASASNAQPAASTASTDPVQKPRVRSLISL